MCIRDRSEADKETDGRHSKNQPTSRKNISPDARQPKCARPVTTAVRQEAIGSQPEERQKWRDEIDEKFQQMKAEMEAMLGKMALQFQGGQQTQQQMPPQLLNLPQTQQMVNQCQFKVVEQQHSSNPFSAMCAVHPAIWQGIAGEEKKPTDMHPCRRARPGPYDVDGRIFHVGMVEMTSGNVVVNACLMDSKHLLHMGLCKLVSNFE